VRVETLGLRQLLRLCLKRVVEEKRLIAFDVEKFWFSKVSNFKVVKTGAMKGKNGERVSGTPLNGCPPTRVNPSGALH
jgi:hypothetical protein